MSMDDLFRKRRREEEQDAMNLRHLEQIHFLL